MKQLESKQNIQSKTRKPGRPQGAKNKSDSMNFRVSIFKIAKKKRICKSLKKSTVDLLNEITIDYFKRILKEAGKLCQESKYKTLNGEKIDMSILNVIQGKIIKGAMMSARRATRLYHQYETSQQSQSLEKY